MLKYFYNDVERHNDTYIIKSVNKKSGTIAETFFSSLVDTYFENNKLIKEQIRFRKFKFDFASLHTIYEIKNYMYDSSGTADEKLLYGCFKYVECLDKYKNIFIILCAKFEDIYIEKYLQTFYKLNLLEQLLDYGVYIILCSDLITDFLYEDNNMTFIKWVGGKSKLIDRILPKINDTDNETVYIEPFIGSGAILIAFLETKPSVKECLCSDDNEKLIITFNQIKKKPKKLIKRMNNLIQEYEQSTDKESFYYSMRDKFNNEKLTNTKIAVLFIFLNKTCYRGLYRINKKGEFNVPYGNYKKPSFIEPNYILHISKLFNEYDVKFSHNSYQEVLSNLNTGTKHTIYLDPPYLNTFDSYTCNKFDSKVFADIVNGLNTPNNKLIVSNSIDFLNEYEKLLPNSEIFDIQDKINSKSPNSIRKEVIIYN